MKKNIKYFIISLLILGYFSQISTVIAAENSYGVETGETYEFSNVGYKYKNSTISGSITVGFTIKIVKYSTEDEEITYDLLWDEKTKEITPAEIVKEFGYTESHWDNGDGKVFADDLGAVENNEIKVGILDLDIKVIINELDLKETRLSFQESRSEELVDGSSESTSKKFAYDEKGILQSFEEKEEFINATDSTQDYEWSLTYNDNSLNNAIIGGIIVVVAVSLAFLYLKKKDKLPNFLKK